MEDYFDGFSEDITKWEIIREMIDLDLDDEFRNEFHKTDPSVQLLPRQDVILYGTIPKMEQRIYSKCKECRLVFNPRDILSHKTCSGKAHLSSTPQNLKKKVKSKGSSSKKSHSSLPPPPLFKKPPSPLTSVSSAPIPETKSSSTKVSTKIPKISTVSSISSSHTVTTTSTKSETRLSSSSPHTSKSNSVHSPKSPSKSVSGTAHSPKSTSKTATSTETIASSSVSSSSSSNSNSSRYKKSRKSNNNTKVTKEFDPDVHCGVIEGNRGPCTRSITCSNHRIQLRKLVPGRSKDIHQLIAERKAAKEKELKHGSYMSPNGSEEKDMFCQNTSYVPIVATIVSTIDSAPTTTYVPIMPKTSTSSTSRSTATSILTAKLNMTDMENKSTKTLDGGYITSIHNNSQDSAIGTVPVVYMPMSPISVVSPVQFVQIGKNMICLESPQSAMSPPLTANQSVFLTIPSQPNNQQPNLKLYKTHPKPVAIPSYGTKKVGGAILLSNQHVECQRNDILMAMNTKREAVNSTQGYGAISLLNHTNIPHRPNILKVKSANKVNCKRPAVDKLNSVSDSKQLRLGPNVNGFILHSDISETADAPQSNNCIQEKIALLNMK
ncbi:protein let-653 isoform X2 [Anoplophora glabripennis]|uniref:protein let-653 isoform X2 n=1 Tax=Anoplophora glabripennis TaxID=217634 RepID=UPI0008740555|nr:protein let-653 isoform X2 [Anoplophora glabripennis]